jgi:hypothetical protein
MLSAMLHLITVSPKPAPVRGVSLALVGVEASPELLRELSAALHVQSTSTEGPVAQRVAVFSVKGYFTPARVIEQLGRVIAGLPAPARSAFETLPRRTLELHLAYDDVHTASGVELDAQAIRTLAELGVSLAVVAVAERDQRT